MDVETFNRTLYFKVGDEVATTKVNATRMRAAFEALPSASTSGVNALQHAMLRKMPAALEQQTRAIEDEFIKAEALKRAPPYTYTELGTVLAQFLIAAVRRSHSASGRQSLTEQPPLSPGAIDTEVNYLGRVPRCPCCGKTGHAAGDCPTACALCGQKACPGNAKEDASGKAQCKPCALQEKAKPPDASLKSAVGGKLPEFVLKKLQTRHSELHAGADAGSGGQQETLKQITAVERNAIDPWEEYVASSSGRSINMLTCEPYVAERAY
jgi:hypothetical protein